MNITKRLYTYPVLTEEKDDYDTSIFDIDFKYQMMGLNIINLNFEISMDNPEIEDLIAKGKAEYVIHVECSVASFRMIKKSKYPIISIDIPTSRINGKVEVIGFITASTNIEDLYIDDWNEDYEGTTFNFSKGTILGYKNLPSLDIFKNYEELKTTNSIFKIHKFLSEDKRNMQVNEEGDWIDIWLSPKEYENYVKYSTNIKFQPVLNTMIVFPALVYVFECLKQSDAGDRYEGKQWFVSLNKSYAKRGIDLMDEVLISEKSSVALAQDAMEFPLTQAFGVITDLFEEEE